ncbi:MAG: S1C family serine protease [Candidatus Dormibacteraceae bacterium]
MAVAGLLLLTGGVGIGLGLARSGLAGLPFAFGQASIQMVPQSRSALHRPAQGLGVRAIAKRVDPAVVDIDTVLESGRGTGRAAGTGMVLTPSGLVVTNNHVVQGATSIRVTVAGRGSHPATVVGVDVAADVALLQVQGVSGLPTVTLADSSSLTVSEPVVAIGNALGQGGAPTVTEGTITALDRSVTASDGAGRAEQLSGMIQTDASISPGDSGGPLVNGAGQVVGMITAASAQGFRQPSSTVGFAIPASTAASVVDQIRSGHASSSIILGQPAFLGVGVENLDPAIAAQLGLNATTGALVVRVVPGSPADRAGMSRYAVITSVDGAQVASAGRLGPAILRHKPGQQVRIGWTDQAGVHTSTVTLATGPAV